jgi:tRNA(Ile)-lysidine synthase
MRILRGTGLYGLSGMLPVRQMCGFTIIRPFLEVRRREIERYLKKRKILPRIDPSNSEDIYLRNKIRNTLLPLLEKRYNRNIKEVLSNLAESAGYDYDYLDRACRKEAGKINSRLDLQKLLKSHQAIRRLMVRLYIARIKGDTRRITFQHIKEIEDLAAHRPQNSVVDLPKGISVIKKKASLVFFLR